MNSVIENGNAVAKDHSPIPHPQLVRGEQLLEMLFDEGARPTMRWLRDQQKARTIPHMKIGRLVFFNPEQVRKALENRQR